MSQFRNTELLERFNLLMTGTFGYFETIFRKIVEGMTGFITVIQGDHRYIHEGLAFSALINTGSISAAYDICFKTPIIGGEWIHWRPATVTSSDQYVAFQLTEGETYTGGDAVTPINRNRNSVNTTEMQAFVKNATCTPTGTILDIGGVGTTGAPQARSGGSAGSEHEILLKPDTIYAFTVTPTGATIVNVHLFWYEED